MRSVPAGVVGTASAFVICTFVPAILRFTKSPHFPAGAIPALFAA
jgi:hypothetical protein